MARHSAFLTLLSTAGAALIVAISANVVLPAQEPAPTRSTRDGVYTAAQAERGEDLFNETCQECHSGRLWGLEWDNKTLADVYDFISQYMPEPAPGSLSAMQVRDAIAYILSSNQLPPGSAEIPTTYDGLKQIRIERAAR